VCIHIIGCKCNSLCVRKPRPQSILFSLGQQPGKNHQLRPRTVGSSSSRFSQLHFSFRQVFVTAQRPTVAKMNIRVVRCQLDCFLILGRTLIGFAFQNEIHRLRWCGGAAGAGPFAWLCCTPQAVSSRVLACDSIQRLAPGRPRNWVCTVKAALYSSMASVVTSLASDTIAQA
jgi:hypothetical protein